MPGRLILTATAGELARRFAADAAPPLPAPGEMRPGMAVAALVAGPEGRRLVAMRWGMIPMGRTNARGRPVLDTIVNVRSETLLAKSAFRGVERCALPVSAWFETTGDGRRRRLWRIGATDRGLLAFAAVFDRWRAPDGSEVLSLASLTCPPNAELAPVHDRGPVLLDASGLALWLGETEGDPATLFVPPPDGSLAVAPA